MCDGLKPASPAPQPTRVTCPRCHGSRNIVTANMGPYNWVKCEECRGKGTVPADPPAGDARLAHLTCPGCGLAGYVAPTIATGVGRCAKCGWSGLIPLRATVPADPPAPAQPAPSAAAYPFCSLTISEVEEWRATHPPDRRASHSDAFGLLMSACWAAGQEGARLSEIAGDVMRRTAEAEAGRAKP